jgi:hypothetical protein
VGWALPYSQRYFYSLHPDKYIQLKQSGFDILSRLQVVVVEKLFYRNIIKSCGASKKRIECSCLLQVCDGDPLFNFCLLFSFLFSLSLSLSLSLSPPNENTLLQTIFQQK